MRFCETGSTPGVPLDFEVAVLWVVVIPFPEEIISSGNYSIFISVADLLLC